MLDHRHAVCYYSWFTKIFALNLKRWDEVRVETALTKALLGRCLACGRVTVAVAVAARAPAAAAAAAAAAVACSSSSAAAAADTYRQWPMMMMMIMTMMRMMKIF